MIRIRRVHSGDLVDFERVAFGLVEFRIGYFSDVLRRVTLGSSQLVTVCLKINYSSYRVCIGLVSV